MKGDDDEAGSETLLALARRMPCLSNGYATALHDAAEGGYTMTCLQLLAAGASLHATDADGDIPVKHNIPEWQPLGRACVCATDAGRVHARLGEGLSCIDLRVVDKRPNRQTKKRPRENSKVKLH